MQLNQGTSADELALKYWETFLRDFQPCLFPALLDESSAPQDNFQECNVQLDVNNRVIEKLCSQHQITLESLFQTAWAIVIGCYAGVEDVSFGYTAEDESSSEDSKCRDVLICRIKATADHQACQVMVDIKKNLDDALAHPDCSIQDIRNNLGLEGQILFNSGFRIQRLSGSDAGGSPTLSTNQRNEDLAEYDIVARALIKDGTSLAVSIRARSYKFSAAQTADIAHTFAKTFESLAIHPQSLVRDLDVVSRRDRDKIMSWNKSCPASADICFHQLFEDIAQKMPDAQALCSWDGNLTYHELNVLSNKLANHLADLGVISETLVPICFDKSSIAIVSMLGILKAGGAFVAIDPSYPDSRIQAILKATNGSVIVTEPAHSGLLKDFINHIVVIDHKSAGELPPARNPIRSQPRHSNTAYVVFTSGSTGAPKGIVVEHRALCTAALALASPMRVTSATRFLQFAAYTFDLSYGDIFVTLSQGGCICVPSEHERVNDIVGAIVRMDVNTACLVPSVARLFRPEDVPCLETLLLGGEALMRENLKLWASKVCLVNLYGPAECTIWTTAQTKLKADSPANNVGRAVAARLWITSSADHDQLRPVGCIGELLIEGPVLARGYLDIEQTNRSFVDNPSWAEAEPAQQRRFYKTGDLAKYNADGTVSFMGRKDTQIKLHGRRIEMGEIEYHLASHNLPRQSMVILPTTGIYRQRLVAVVVLKTNKASTTNAGELKRVTGLAKETSTSELEKVKNFLSSRVPSYMVPQYWVIVEDIPLMISGKMDRVRARRFVESIEDENLEEEAVKGWNPSTDYGNMVEIRLRNIWSHVLDRKATEIGVEQDFVSLGGDSFSAMDVVARCKTEGLGLTVHDVLSSSTIRQMASKVKIPLPEIAPNEHDVPEVPDSSCVALKFPPVWWHLQPALVSSIRA